MGADEVEDALLRTNEDVVGAERASDGAGAPKDAMGVADEPGCGVAAGAGVVGTKNPVAEAAGVGADVEGGGTKPIMPFCCCCCCCG